MKFRVLPQANGEAIAAAIWYEERQSGLAQCFIDDIEQALSEIPQSPFSAPMKEHYSGPHQIRRRILRRFPFAVIYLCRDDQVVVVATAHTRRRPFYWLSRLD